MLNDNERQFLTHWSRFGSDGYPVRKVAGNRWLWDEQFGIKGAPIVYRTKRECVAAIEAYITVLLDKNAGRDHV